MDKEKNKKNEERLKYLDNQLDELAQTQEEELLIDFDEIIEEEEEKGLKVKFENKIYVLPAKMPFSFGMFFFRNCYKVKKGKTSIEVPDALTLEFIERMFGEKFLKDLESSKKNIAFQTIFDKFAFKIFKNWGIDLDSPEGQKKIKEMKSKIQQI